jgi:hypothetical protein
MYQIFLWNVYISSISRRVSLKIKKRKKTRAISSDGNLIAFISRSEIDTAPGPLREMHRNGQSKELFGDTGARMQKLARRVVRLANQRDHLLTREMEPAKTLPGVKHATIPVFST